MTLQAHAVADIFPLMSAAEFAELKRDVAENGQREPITLYEGRIIDGRNRYRACEELGKEPLTRQWDGNGSLINYIISLNLHRRHLTAAQRAVVATEILPFLEAEAKERQREAGGNHNEKPVVQKIEQPVSRASQQAAALLQTNHSYVSIAKRLKRDAPELLEQVRAGSLGMLKADEQHRDNRRAAGTLEPRQKRGPAPAVQKARVEEIWDLLRELHSLTSAQKLHVPHSQIREKVAHLKDRFYIRFIRSQAE
jgi:ParB-like chromosome segregation protein Spo0J